MSVELNHIIVPAYDKRDSAEFLARILDLPVGAPTGPFVPVHLTNGVTLDFADATEFSTQHCAFLVNSAEFDAALTRVKQSGVTYYADPGHHRVEEIAHRGAGRAFYFDDPAGHNMEVMHTA